MHVNLDDLKRLALEDGNDFREACTAEVVIHLIDSIATLMDEDSILAAQQRVSKQAIDSTIAARKERNEALAAVEELRGQLAAMREERDNEQKIATEWERRAEVLQETVGELRPERDTLLELVAWSIGTTECVIGRGEEGESDDEEDLLDAKEKVREMRAACGLDPDKDSMDQVEAWNALWARIDLAKRKRQ